MKKGPKVKFALPGDRFGKLVVYKEAAKSNSSRRVWCKCDCGNICPIQVNNLTAGSTTSCGCTQAATVSRERARYLNQEVFKWGWR